MPLSRRQLLKLSAASLLAANLWPSRAHAAESPTKPLKFLQVNDFHYFDDKCAPFFEGLIKEFNQVPDAAFLLLVGDLVDGGTAGQCHAIHDILSALKIPYYITCGNHDPISQTDRAPFESVFGNKLNTNFEANGWQFVGLDTSDGQKSANFDCHKETLDYAATLPSTLSKDKPTFLYTHFPLGPGVTNRLKNADTLLEPFKQLNLAAIFNGHYHAYTQKTIGTSAICTTDVCCSFKRANHDNTFQKGFFTIEAKDNKFTRTFTDYGTTYPASATPNNKPLPSPTPTQPQDLSHPWY